MYVCMYVFIWEHHLLCSVCLWLGRSMAWSVPSFFLSFRVFELLFSLSLSHMRQTDRHHHYYVRCKVKFLWGFRIRVYHTYFTLTLRKKVTSSEVRETIGDIFASLCFALLCDSSLLTIPIFYFCLRFYFLIDLKGTDRMGWDGFW